MRQEPIERGGSLVLTLTLVAVCLLAVVFPLFIAPQFKLMFSDFASELPTLTKFALKRWFGPVVATPSIVLVGAALMEPLVSNKRSTYIVSAFLLAAIGVMLMIAAMYWPIFEMAGNIRAA